MKLKRMLKLGRKVVGRSDGVAMRQADQARDQGDIVQAADLYARVPRHDRHYRAAQIQRGNLCKDLGRFDQARRAYAAAWNLNDRDADLALQTARLHTRSGRLDDAVTWYERALDIDSANVHAKAEVERIRSLSSSTIGDFHDMWAVDPANSKEALSRITSAAIGDGDLDLNYYKSKYDPIKSDFEVMDEYVRCSFMNGRSYSAKFSSIGYIMSNRDVGTDAMSPIDHYREYGKSGHRSVSAVYDKFTTVNSPYDMPVQCAGDGHPSIAIHIHIFYEDYIPRFRRYLSRFPYPFSLLVSRAPSVPDAAIEILRTLNKVKEVIVKVAENRGRNFGPLLADFRDEIGAADYCCHLHSKKSLHSGSEQVGWASYQLEHLVGDPNLVRMHINAFEQDDAVALIAPVPFWKAPYWASHWLQNEHHGAALLKRMGLRPKEGFLPYPVGGMFWFRPSGMRPLLDIEWKYEDFPEERGQIDGTVQHALERAVSSVATRDGCMALYYEPWSHAYSVNEYDILAEYRRLTPNVVLNAGLHHKVTSFDIFDTVVYRASLDKEVGKRRVAERLAAAGHAEAASNFVEARNAREYELRKAMGFAGDVSLVEIYEALARNGDLAGQNASALLAIEFEADLEDQKPRLAVVEIINELVDRGREVIFVSDTYYSEDQLRRMLRQAGIHHVGSVFASSEIRQRKDTGRMWSQVADDMRISLSDLYHVGDNVVSDVQKAGDFGVRNGLILNLIDKASYLMGRDLNDPEEFARACEAGLKPAIIAAGKNPFFSH